MKKNSNKGFLLVETLVVATFCVTVLVMLYLQFRTLVINYNNSYNYNTVEGVYKLNSIKKYLQDNGNVGSLSSSPYNFVGRNGNCDSLPSSYNNKDFCKYLLEAGDFKTVIYINSDSSSRLSSAATNINSTSAGMANFIRQLDYDRGKKRLVAEYGNGTFASITFS